MNLKKTKIVFTIGPASSDEAVLEALFKAGANVCRINAAHAGPQAIEEAIHKVQAVNRKLGTFVATLVDIKGPEIRTGELFIRQNAQLVRQEKLELVSEQHLYFVFEPNPTLPENMAQVCLNYPGIIEDVTVGQTLLLDNGLLSLQVVAVGENHLQVKVLIGGTLGQKRHVNLPGVYVRLPSITEKDKEDALVAVKAGVDFVALSFVRSAQDVTNLRAYLRDIESDAKIISKIEDESGVRNLEEIIKASDGLMVARGDLGIETPIESIPHEQSRMVSQCHKYGKPVVIATHMLESMIQSPIPTRAEVSDIAHAVGVDQADAIMLSGETGIGLYPVECVRMMANVSRVQEAALPLRPVTVFPLNESKERLVACAVQLAQSMGGASIVVFTRDGFTAKILATLRPAHCRVFACTDSEAVAREMSLYWGVEAILLSLGEHHMSEDFAVNEAIYQLRGRRLVTEGEELVVLAKTAVVPQGTKIGEMVDSLQVRQVK